MGDVAMLVPVIYAFAKAYPETKITFLSKPFFKPLIETLPNVQFFGAETALKHKGISGLWKLSRSLKKLGITHLADTHNVLRSKILRAFLALPAATIDKGRAEKKALTQSENKVFKPLKTTIQRYVQVFAELGFTGIQPEVLPKPVSTETVLQFTKLDAKRWIGIAPYAAHQGKEYPEKQMREVIVGLDANPDVRLFLFGAPSERERLERLALDCDTATIVAGALQFADEINQIAQLDTMLSMDSGNGHIAAMFGIPTVTLWGVTHPYAGFAPFKQETRCLVSDREQYPAIPTSIYGNKIPEGYEGVMQTIAPAFVVKNVLAATGPV